MSEKVLDLDKLVDYTHIAKLRYKIDQSLTWESSGGGHQALLHARRVDDVAPLEDAGVEQRDGSGNDWTSHAVGEHSV